MVTENGDVLRLAGPQTIEVEADLAKRIIPFLGQGGTHRGGREVSPFVTLLPLPITPCSLVRNNPRPSLRPPPNTVNSSATQTKQ